MKQSLNEEILTRAHQYHNARYPLLVIITLYILSFLFLIAFGVFVVIGIIRQDIDKIESLIAIAIFIVSLVEWIQIVFRNVIWKRAIKKLFNSANTIEREINYSDSKVTIESDGEVDTFKWEFYKSWLKKNDLLLLYRNTKFLDISGIKKFDVIDLSQLTKEEKDSFMEMLTKKVKRIHNPSTR